MLPSKKALVRVAIACNSKEMRLRTRRILEQQGLIVVADGPLELPFLTTAESYHANVLFVELDEAYEEQAQVLEKLLEQASLPMLFNEGIFQDKKKRTTLAKWGQRVSEKLTKLATSTPPRITATGETATPINSVGFSVEEEKAPQRVWVLGASTGGPQALRRFLSAIPGTLPIAFIVAQHIGSNFLELFTKQLSKYTRFSVEVPKSGHLLQHQQILIAPEKHDLSFDDNCCLTLLPTVRDYRYSPSIDLLMCKVSERFGPMAGAIIFSGMGDDGAQGCRYLFANGGTVWAQDAASCEISSMPDYARATGAVSFSAPPEELARNLVKLLGKAKDGASQQGAIN